MTEDFEYGRGDEVVVTGRAASGDSQRGIVLTAGEVVLRTPEADPMISGTTHSDSALVELEDGRFVVVNLRSIEPVHDREGDSANG